MLLRVSDVHKRYREGDSVHVVLDGASFEVRPGEIVALLGPSGSGKSTLLNVVAGIERPDSGRVRIGETDLTALDERERTLFRRRHIGFVFQAWNLVPTLTVEENLLLPLELNRRPGGRQAAAAALARVGLAQRRGSYPDRLSGGEQQRVAVVRAIMHEPLLVLADEPTGNLDGPTGDVVLDLLESLTRAAGRSLFVATHSAQVVRRADRVLHLRDGCVTEAPPAMAGGPGEPAGR